MQKITETEKEYMRNAAELKRCRRALGLAFFGFMSVAFMGIFFGIIIMISASYDALFLLIDGIIIYGALVYCAMKGCKDHWDLMVIFAGALPVFNLLLLGVASMNVGGKIYGHISFNVVKYAMYPTVFFSFITLVCALIALKNNSIFRGLETQPGYPHFNIRELEQEFDKIQMNIKSPYQQTVERLKKTERSDMKELTVPVTEQPEASVTKQDYMDEI